MEFQGTQFFVLCCMDLFLSSLGMVHKAAGKEQNATSGFDSRLNPWSCVVRPLTTAGSAKMSFYLAQVAFFAQSLVQYLTIKFIFEFNHYKYAYNWNKYN